MEPLLYTFFFSRKRLFFHQFFSMLLLLLLLVIIFRQQYYQLLHYHVMIYCLSFSAQSPRSAIYIRFIFSSGSWFAQHFCRRFYEHKLFICVCKKRTILQNGWFLLLDFRSKACFIITLYVYHSMFNILHTFELLH